MKWSDFLAVALPLWFAITGLITWGIARGGAIRERDSRRDAEQRQGDPLTDRPSAVSVSTIHNGAFK